MIKAIETMYKGYRFRSRLEARWAVFFDALELDWEYEPEGFDLGEAGWYLPDFFVGGEYIEIKREQAFKPNAVNKKVYLAGKVSEGTEDYWGIDRWREQIADDQADEGMFEGYRGFSFDHTKDWHLTRGFDYIGPFFTCNHGTPSSHERALRQIDNCDFLFAWIDSNDAYGTICEIVYAKTINKPVYIAFGPNCDARDLWFVAKFAHETIGAEDIDRHSIRENVTVKDAWARLTKCENPYQNLTDDEIKIAELSKSTGICHLIHGDPVSHVLYTYTNGFTDGLKRAFGKPDFGSIEKQQRAAAKARSARFEHGESP